MICRAFFIKITANIHFFFKIIIINIIIHSNI